MTKNRIRGFILLLLSFIAVILSFSCVIITSGTRGIDVSHHNWVDWKTVSKETDMKYAFVKITEGSTFVDPDGKRNIINAEASGIPVGAYHYFTTQTSSKGQFRNFKSHFIEQSELVPMVDVEETDQISRQELNEAVKEFSLLIEGEYGVKPVIYTKPGIYLSVFARYDYSFWKDYTFYFWQPIPIHPLFSTGRGKCIWQFSTNRARIAGTSIIDKDVLSFIDLSEIRRNK